MSKRKPKVEDAPQQPKMVSDHSVPNNATLDKLGRDTVYLMLRNASKAIDRLRAEVAAKDAALSAADKLAAACANSLKPPERIQIDMPELVLDYKRARKATP